MRSAFPSLAIAFLCACGTSTTPDDASVKNDAAGASDVGSSDAPSGDCDAAAGACTMSISGALDASLPCSVIVFNLSPTTDMLQVITQGAGNVGAFVECKGAHPLAAGALTGCVSQLATYAPDAAVDQSWNGGGSATLAVACPPSGSADGDLSGDAGVASIHTNF